MNELTALIIGALWVTTGRGFNLCLVIFLYYVLFIFTDFLSLYEADLSVFSDVASYYILQAWLDVSVVLACLLLSGKNKKIIILCRTYAAIIATSLLCDSMMIVNVELDFEWLYALHESRQLFSIPIDLFFCTAREWYL